jgi:hypothetical protein
MSNVCLYFLRQPERDRWIFGDRFVRPVIRRAIRGRPPASGVDKVFTNLCVGLDRIGAKYTVNRPFREIRDEDRVGFMGRGPWALGGYNRQNPLVAGPYLMTHPIEWPTLCDEYPVSRYLQHCSWATDIYKPYFGDRCINWAHGVDTNDWKPSTMEKDIDVLIYDKVRWEREHFEPNLIQPVRESLQQRGLRIAEIRYGFYKEEDYRGLLSRARSMIFLVEHESQGSACQECLSCDVPIFAWEQGWYLDPNQSKWGQSKTPASSVPYFDKRCGMKFNDITEFKTLVDAFFTSVNNGNFSPREYVLEHLTIERCAQRYYEILDEVAAETIHHGISDNRQGHTQSLTPTHKRSR